MANPNSVIPGLSEVETGVRNAPALADALSSVLSDTYRLMIKTHSYHWNVEGPLFHAIHTMTEEQYQDLFEATDELAERIRALGHLAPGRIDEITGGSVVGDTVDNATAVRMAADLAADHERLAQRLHALIRMAEAQNDPVTADMATARSAAHEKSAWMLRATAK
ncbi:DNA starvation/stationary phase protection protein [Rhodobacteraceae bacterium 2CG4]|uniref:DNA starvation/stationary phase protection protein n=1 Tax=Halovulum marinum TaxID=2662447 RepID=A0A6L5YYY2_9RHOB|nr:DNA starvation/stationary phase protection protein [Halovulum marinum]MSU89045.1 DNA starvation/stationary phase protection protein [Halovulum marinum]